MVWVVRDTEPAGRVLAVAAVALLGSLAVTGTVVRPRLAADRAGLTVGRLGRSRSWPWPAVRRVEVVGSRRLGRRPGVLELDTVDPDGTEHLVILTRLDLGSDPYDVADRLHALCQAE